MSHYERHPNRKPKKKTRSDKVKDTEAKMVKEKFLEERNNPPPLIAKTPTQKDYLYYLNNMQVIVAEGSSGVGKCEIAGSLVSTTEGLIPIEDLHPTDEAGYFDIDIDVNTKDGVKKATKFYVEDDVETIKVVTSQGYEIEGTPEHPMFVFENGEYKFKKLEDVKLGEVFAVQRSKYVLPTENPKIDFVYRAGTPRYIPDTSVKIPTEMSVDLAKWLGYLLANGSTNGNTVSFSSTYKDIVESYNSMCKTLFNKQIRSCSRYCNHNMNSKEIRQFLDYMFDGFTTARFKTIPEIILRSPKEVQAAFLQALFDCDSYCDTGRSMEFCSASKKVANTVHIMLLQFGIHARKRPKVVKGYEDHTYWVMDITGTNYDLLFKEVMKESIKYEHEQKNRNPNIDLVYGLNEIINDKLKLIRDELSATPSGHYKTTDGKSARFLLTKHFYSSPTKEVSFLNLQYLLKGYEESTQQVKDCFDKHLSIVHEVLQYNFFHDTITSIEKGEKQRVYDLTVPDGHNFIANGLVSHNTYLASAIAADRLRKGDITKIIVARPYVCTGKSSGLKPGSTLEKLYPFVRNMLDTMKKRMGAGAFEVALRDGLSGDIEVQDIESIRGRSFDEPSILIIDEAQQTTKEEMIAIVTRISDNCQLVLCGDPEQKDIHGESGLEWFTDFAKRHELDVGIVHFTSDDIIRGGLVKSIVKGLEKDKVFKKH